jgi:hypothetical protein
MTGLPVITAGSDRIPCVATAAPPYLMATIPPGVTGLPTRLVESAGSPPRMSRVSCSNPLERLQYRDAPGDGHRIGGLMRAATGPNKEKPQAREPGGPESLAPRDELTVR